jgi:uncharacterized membrane protein
MSLLILGVALFAGVHFIPSLAPALKAAWVGRMGENGYKGIFSLLLMASLGLMIFGWRAAIPQGVYAPPPGLHHLALALLVIAFLLMVVSGRPSRIKRAIRHPQLTGVGLWGLAHLLLNGDNRSVVLFGGMLVWACVEIWAINRREGVWIKDETPPWSADVVNLVATAVTVAVVVFIHPWLSGRPVW